MKEPSFFNSGDSHSGTLSVTGSAYFGYIVSPSLTIAGAGNTTISGSIDVFAGLNKQGSGTLTLSAPYAYGSPAEIRGHNTSIDKIGGGC
jgi:hypothetical protein